jgi:hypothetical protein
MEQRLYRFNLFTAPGCPPISFQVRSYRVEAAPLRVRAAECPLIKLGGIFGGIIACDA